MELAGAVGDPAGGDWSGLGYRPQHYLSRAIYLRQSTRPLEADEYRRAELPALCLDDPN